MNGRKGITADLNGVYFVNVVDVNSVDGLVQIETRPDAGRTDIGPKQRFWIEPSMLYPLIKGAADFSAFRVAPRENLFAIVPNKGVSNDACDMAQHLLDTTNQRTKNYLSNFEPLLKNRSTLKRYMRGKPYYSIYNVGPYTFAPYKVVWAEQSSTFASAVVTSANVPLLGQKVFVPDHKVFFVDFSDPAPAYYLCGLLNSNDVREFIESHNISIQTGDIFKHMNLPAFDSQNAKHLELSRLVELAHNDGLDDQLRQSIMDCADILL
ncbi:hypothetical protein GCM10025859_63630 [Alicyclobacillus fastidiosus]|nr:hypothetical protein GCM10025859_61880 [Alicyclobacillus fastidiosus]GMA65922.1 hypothetical protein GCM10025859_63630 [Alicyclobacillus fastidiosus]